MAKEIKGVAIKGEYLGFFEVPGKDGKKYLYAQVLQNDGGKSSIVDVRVKSISVLEHYVEGEPIDIKVNIQELFTKDGKPFIVVDAA